MARLPAGAFCGWRNLGEENQRTFEDAPGRLEIKRYVDAGSTPKAVDRLDVKESISTLATRVVKHLKAARQSGLGGDQPVVLLFWPHHENSMAMLLRDLIIRSGDASLLNKRIRVIDLAAAMHWSPHLTTYTGITALAEVASVNSHEIERKNEPEARVRFMQLLLRLLANPIEPSPSLSQLNDYLDRAADPTPLGRYLGEYLARRILGARTKTIASLKKWPTVTARLLTRYDVKCWFFVAITRDLRDDLLLLTAYGISQGIRDGWATEPGIRQLLALIGTPAYLAWLADVRSRTPPNTRPGRPGVPHQFRVQEQVIDLQAAMRNILWTGTGPYRGPTETVTYPVNSGFVKWVIRTREEIETWRRAEKRSAYVSAYANATDSALDDTNIEVITLSDASSDSSS